MLRLSRHAAPDVDTTSVAALASALEDRHRDEVIGHDHLVSLLHHLFILPGPPALREQRLRLVSLPAQQVCTQEEGVDPDVVVTKIDVTAFMQQGANREDVVAAKKERNRAIEKKEEYDVFFLLLL